MQYKESLSKSQIPNSQGTAMRDTKSPEKGQIGLILDPLFCLFLQIFFLCVCVAESSQFLFGLSVIVNFAIFHSTPKKSCKRPRIMPGKVIVYKRSEM